MFKLDLEKAEGPEIKLPKFVGSLKKWEFQKNIYFCFIDYAKALDFVDHSRLDLIDRMPDEIWTEVYDTVQETGIKTIANKKECKKQNGCLGRPYK